MYLDQINSCCGIGELSQFEQIIEENEQFPEDCYFLEEDLIDLQNQIKNNNFDLIVATTPDSERWVPIHWLLTLADFIPITSAKSKHGNYQNILWIYQKDPKKWMI